jgi:hypothetical protein
MVKTVITPQENTYPLIIPANYIGKKVEILIYSIDEFIENRGISEKKPSDFFGTLSASDGEKFQNYVTNSRLEWDRNI